MAASTLEWPASIRVRATNFRLQHLQSVNPVRSGDHQAIEFGEPLWLCDLSTPPLSRAQAAELKAFALKLRGALRTFYLWDHAMARPAAYASVADSAWYASSETVLASSEASLASGETIPWGCPYVTEYDEANGLIKVVGLAAGATLSAHDFGAWDDGPARRLAAVTDTIVADASGEAWVAVELGPPSDESNLPALLHLDKAAAEMRLVSFSAPFETGSFWAASATAGQVLRRS